MALSARLEMRQSQSLVMTPQLQQAIKLLQLSHVDLATFVEQELERNPLLERKDGQNASLLSEPNSTEHSPLDSSSAENQSAKETTSEELSIGQVAEDFSHSQDMDAEIDNVYPDAGISNANDFADAGLGQASFQSMRSGGGSFDTENGNIEQYLASEPSLKDHLLDQLSVAGLSPSDRLIGADLIELVDDSGYIRSGLEDVALRLGTSLSAVEQILKTLQGFEPAGVCARTLSECLALQLKDRNRYDPMISKVIDHLDLLAARKYPELKRRSGASDEDLADIIAEITSLDPKPGMRFGRVDMQPVVADVLINRRNDGSWHVELNSETLPKVLIDRRYYATVSAAAASEEDKSYLTDCMQTANWLVKSLDQRARTILKVSQEIVRQQDGFFIHGVQHLRPLNLKTVADAISMHESTVSRVTSNKYIGTDRGIFEMKYFFTSAIASSGDGDALSSEAVRFRIKKLIDSEPPTKVLSDDKIVTYLRNEGIDIARRTVAKYREAMRIPSSVQRRREKKTILLASA